VEAASRCSWVLPSRVFLGRGAPVNLILLDPSEIRDNGAVRLSDQRASHLLAVLKVAPGHEVRVGVLDSVRGIGTVTSVADDAVELRCAFETLIPPRPTVDLLLALPRPKVMRRLWAQLAALGVGQIILTNAARVERHYFDTHVLAPECYRPLLIEGLQQARDTRMPAVSIHRQFKVLIEDRLDTLFPAGHRLVTHPGCDRPIADLARTRSHERILLAIGPEGGWNEFELRLLEAHGFQAVGMGPRALRSDTACIALITLAHSR
jgi:16S rRNA (uracil1498-N3)-methyltransferase